MKRLNPLFLLFCLLTFFLPDKNLDAQSVNQQDYNALIKLYHATDGENWDDNTNWLSSAPISDWEGVITDVIGGEIRVWKLHLGNNNLTGAIPQEVADSLSELFSFQLHWNKLTSIPDFTSSPNLMYIYVQYNNLTFESLEPNLPTNPNVVVFNYSNQDTFYGEEVYVDREPDDPYLMIGEAGASATTNYTWYKAGSPNENIGTGNTKDLGKLEVSDAGTYFWVATSTHPGLTSMTLTRRMVHLGVQKEVCKDSFGAYIDCDSLIIEINPSLTPPQVSLLLQKLKFSAGQTCPCTDVNLVGIDWTLSIERASESAEETAETTEQLEEEGFGYNYKGIKPKAIANAGGSFTPPPKTKGTTLVAILDTGVEFDYATQPYLTPLRWENLVDNNINGIDEDANCYTDDRFGWNFPDDTYNNLSDQVGHGTEIANIITYTQPGSTAAELMNLRVFDENGEGDLFPAICAIYYAAEKNADVINMSWGYEGEASDPLKKAIQHAGVDAGSIVVTSAGNSYNDNDAIPHYPSNYELDNLISVGAYQLGTNAWWHIASDHGSNYSSRFVDLAAPGVGIPTKSLGGVKKSVTGTSFAAAYVSGVLASLIENYPTASPKALKHCLMESVVYDPSYADKCTAEGRINLTQSDLCLNGFEYLTKTKSLLDLNVLLEGAISSTGIMTNKLRQDNLIPLYQPYNTAPWNHNGGEVLNPDLLLNQSISHHNIVDWVLVSFVDPADAENALTTAALVRRDGKVVNYYNGGLLEMPSDPGYRHITIVHRNHLGVMTKEMMSFDYQPSKIDFSDPSTLTFGTSGQKYMPTTDLNLLYAGNATKDNVIDAADRSAISNKDGNTDYYDETDINMDGETNLTDWGRSFLNRNTISQCSTCH